jgi:hypothetical protein
MRSPLMASAGCNKLTKVGILASFRSRQTNARKLEMPLSRIHRQLMPSLSQGWATGY